MKRLMILPVLFLVGCVTTGQQSKAYILGEAIGVALLSYEISDINDDKERAYYAIQQADEYLDIVSNGDTLAELIHSMIPSDPRTRRLVAIAKLVLNANGTLVGNSWAEALDLVDADL